MNVETLEINEIPFTVQVRHQLADVVKFEFDPAPDTFTAKAIRHAVTSPDGSTLVFNAAGYLWTKDLPNGKPERLTNEENLEFEPAFSPDGNTLAYVTWSDDEHGAIKTLSVNESNARPVKITEKKGIYRQPSFSPDGQTTCFSAGVRK